MSEITSSGRKRFRLSALPGSNRYGKCEGCGKQAEASYILTIEKEMIDDPLFSGETWWRHAAQIVGHHDCLLNVVRDETKVL